MIIEPKNVVAWPTKSSRKSRCRRSGPMSIVASRDEPARARTRDRRSGTEPLGLVQLVAGHVSATVLEAALDLALGVALRRCRAACRARLLPRASASSTFARPSLKYSRVGTSVSPFSRTRRGAGRSRAGGAGACGRARVVVRDAALVVGGDVRADEPDLAVRARRRRRAASVARPSRSAFTSVPGSTSPASTRSSSSYSCRARRLSAISFSPVWVRHAPSVGRVANRNVPTECCRR